MYSLTIGRVHFLLPKIMYAQLTLLMQVAYLGRPCHTVSMSTNMFYICTNYVTHELFLPLYCYLPTPVSKYIPLLSTLIYSVVKKDSIRKMNELCLLSWTNLNLIRDSTYTPSQWHRQSLGGLLLLDYWGDHPIIIREVILWSDNRDPEYWLLPKEQISLEKSQENLIFCMFGPNWTARNPVPRDLQGSCLLHCINHNVVNKLIYNIMRSEEHTSELQSPK
jgi:hypothetical protein